MRAVRLEAVGQVALGEVAEPQAGAGELVLAVTAAGICGSDRHILDGTYPASPPVTLGHEFEGTVVATGPGVALGVGSRVTVDPNVSCGRCDSCRRGAPAHCGALSPLGVVRDGGLAEYVVVPEAQTYELSPGLEPGLGALCEPLACCLRASDHASVGPGESVVIFGGGVMGQMLVQLSRLAGAVQVVLVTRQAERRRLAERLGATVTLDPDAGPVVEAIVGTRGLVPGGVDVAFEAAGVADTFTGALGVVAPRGRVIVVGAAAAGERMTIEPYDLFARELRIQGSFLNPLTHGRAAALVGAGVLELGPLVTRRIGLDAVPDMLTHPPARGEVKVLVVAV